MFLVLCDFRRSLSYSYRFDERANNRAHDDDVKIRAASVGILSQVVRRKSKPRKVTSQLHVAICHVNMQMPHPDGNAFDILIFVKGD